MRFEVPQFIEIEDKIFGPFTWKQFIYIGGGSITVAVLFFMTPFVVFLLVGGPIGLLSFLLAFYPVNHRPFSIFLESMLRYLKNHRLYLWQKKGTGIYSDMAAPSGPATYIPPTNNSNLTSLSRKLELKAIQKQ